MCVCVCVCVCVCIFLYIYMCSLAYSNKRILLLLFMGIDGLVAQWIGIWLHDKKQRWLSMENFQRGQM